MLSALWFLLKIKEMGLDEFFVKLNYFKTQLKSIPDYEIDFLFEKANEYKLNRKDKIKLAKLIIERRKIIYDDEYNLKMIKGKKKIILYKPEDKIFKSIKELAKYLNIPYSTLYKKIIKKDPKFEIIEKRKK